MPIVFFGAKISLRFLVLIVASALIYSVCASDSAPASSNINNAEYPRVGSDLSVTFRLKAPNAKEVKLEGGTGLIKAPLVMTNSPDGRWSATTPPSTILTSLPGLER